MLYHLQMVQTSVKNAVLHLMGFNHVPGICLGWGLPCASCRHCGGRSDMADATRTTRRKHRINYAGKCTPEGISILYNRLTQQLGCSSSCQAGCCSQQQQQKTARKLQLSERQQGRSHPCGQ